MSCNCGKPKCDGKCGISPAVLQINNNDCTLFHRVEIPAAMGDEKTNPPKTGAYRNVLLYYAASGNSYLYSSDGIPTKLTGVVSDYEVLLNKPWINGVELIGNKTLADLGIISAIDTAVAAEATARANADNALSSRISTNTGKINTNTTAIANEKTARENADTALQNNISAESQARIDADAGLQSQINSTSGAVAAERDARILADNALGTRIDNVSGSVTNEENARIDADAGLQDQIDAVRSTAESALTPDDIDYTVMTDVDVSANTSTSAVNLDGSKVNLKTGTTSSKIISLPVASSTQAGVMNSSTFDAISSNTNNIQAILNGAVAVNGLPTNPTQAQLTTAWQNETGLSTLINRASIYDVTNSKVWTYYTNDSTWHAAANSSQVTVNTFTNSSEGLIKGSTNVGQVFAESDGTGSVNGWDALSDAVNDATTKLAGIQNGAEQNVQSDWNVTDTSSDAYIKNKPTIPTVNNGTLTIQKNGASVGTFTANQSGNSTANITVPTKTSDISNDSGFITASDIPAINNGTLTIQKNGANVQTFTANSATNKTANIEVPTKTSELENDSGFIVNDTHAVCDEGGSITLDGTTVEPLVFDSLKGNTEQQTYTGKNLANVANATAGYSAATQTVSNKVVATGSFDITESGSYAGVWSAYAVINVQLSPNTQYTLTRTFSVVSGTTYTGVGNIRAKVGNSYTNPTTAASLTFTTDSTGTVQLLFYSGYNQAATTTINTTVRFSNVQLEQSSSATSFEPYVGGIPAPNPDYPQAVQTVTGENVAKICGKNILPVQIGSQTNTGITMTKNADGSLTFNGTATGNAYFNLNNSAGGWAHLEGGKTYTLSTTTPLPTNTRLCCRNATGSTTNYIDIYGGNQTSETTTMAVDDNTFTYFAVYGAGTVVNNLTIYPMLEQSATATAYEPYQSQSYEVNLGKNLFDGDAATDAYIESDGTLTPNPVWRASQLIKVKPNTSYIWHGESYGTPNQVEWAGYDGSEAFISGQFRQVNGVTSTVITTGAKTEYLRVGYRSDKLMNMQLELGSQATSYAAYFEPIELCKIGDDGEGGYLYKDSIYKNLTDNKWYVHKETGKRTYTADDITIAASDTYSNVRYAQFPKGADNKQNGNYTYGGIINFFTHGINMGATPAGGWNSYISDGLIYNSAMQDNYWCSFAKSTTLATMKEKLNGMVAYYALATPTDTEITNEALIEQLEALWRADGYDGQTHITALYADGNAQMQLAVCQYPSHLPIATTSQLGAVIVGDGLQIEPDGRLDVIVDDELSATSRNPVQNAVVTEALAGKANNADLSAVATTGSFNDLVDQPTIPTVNNATLTIQKNGTNVATFTANSSTNATANITVPNITLTDVDPGEGGTLAANNFIGVYV